MLDYCSCTRFAEFARLLGAGPRLCVLELRAAQAKNRVIDAELLLKKAFFTDVSPALAAWRKANKLPADPLAEHRRSGYERKAAADRKARRKAMGISRGGSYA